MEKILEEKEAELLAKGEVSLIIESYDQIFSNFDPRPYSHRSMSTDFIDEARRATRDVDSGEFELRFLLPVSKRNVEKENMIKKRLKDHFRKHADLLSRESWTQIRRGIFLSIIGFLMMMTATYILHSGNNGLTFNILYIFFEPGGWFTLWTGLDSLFSFAKEKNHDLEFYRKMTRVNIAFSHY